MHRITKEFISKSSLLKNLPSPLFASAPADSPRRKRGVYSLPLEKGG